MAKNNIEYINKVIVEGINNIVKNKENNNKSDNEFGREKIVNINHYNNAINQNKEKRDVFLKTSYYIIGQNINNHFFDSFVSIYMKNEVIN